jgi:hypothetical protein
MKGKMQVLLGDAPETVMHTSDPVKDTGLQRRYLFPKNIL